MLKYVYILLACGVASLSAFTVADGFATPDTQQIISMRRIGHKLLLASKDSTSRVLPVRQVGAGKFEIRLEKPVALNPDALVDIITKEEKAGLLPPRYTVAVHSSADDSIYYAYSAPLQEGELQPCVGRLLPRAHYYITVSLNDDTNVAWLSAGMVPVFFFLGWRAFYKKKAPDAVMPTPAATRNIRIGSAAFYPELQKLEIQQEYISLTGKETQVLRIFAQCINEEVPRERLQKEVWEDEGVIVGRSLDMFISKLRKKLSPDPNIQIVSIHGKGYKLIVE